VVKALGTGSLCRMFLFFPLPLLPRHGQTLFRFPLVGEWLAGQWPGVAWAERVGWAPALVPVMVLG